MDTAKIISELNYLHDKLRNVDIVKLNLYLLPSIRGYIISGCVHQGCKHGIEYELMKIADDARTNRYGKCFESHLKDIDITMAANDFYDATLISCNVVGTKNELKVIKFQEPKIIKAKKVLDLL